MKNETVMSERDSSGLRIFLAVLPVMGLAGDAQSALMLGAVVLAGFWGLAAFFSLTGFLFPRPLIRPAYLLGCAVLVYSVRQWIGFPAFWILSLIILMPPAVDSRADCPGLKKTVILRGLGFLLLILYLGIMHEILSMRFLVGIFSVPAGTFLLLAVAAFAWKNQPREQVSSQDSVNPHEGAQ